MVTGLSSTSARSQTLNASSRGLWANRQIDSNLGCLAVKLAISYSLYYIFSRPVSILLSSAALCRSPVCVSLSVCLKLCLPVGLYSFYCAGDSGRRMVISMNSGAERFTVIITITVHRLRPKVAVSVK